MLLQSVIQFTFNEKKKYNDPFDYCAMCATEMTNLQKPSFPSACLWFSIFADNQAI